MEKAFNILIGLTNVAIGTANICRSIEEINEEKKVNSNVLPAVAGTLQILIGSFLVKLTTED